MIVFTSEVVFIRRRTVTLLFASSHMILPLKKKCGIFLLF